ncbi:uncharacterized protein LOC126379110 isoform X2 [Pectinophora gossypiella]|uniref:uncharacterized protein LOC126379110 isoform X2 n=1 Tax=Pectinophora gossypiella TaxID=13191 RepID=UPI00214E5BF5|nr:uncharacterized protein LOC126379110 isoform X2 [Pectinophora gossypiella]
MRLMLKHVLFSLIIHFVNGQTIDVSGIDYNKVTKNPHSWDYYYTYGETINWKCVAQTDHAYWIFPLSRSECSEEKSTLISIKGLTDKNDGQIVICEYRDYKEVKESIKITLRYVPGSYIRVIGINYDKVKARSLNNLDYYYDEGEILNWRCTTTYTWSSTKWLKACQSISIPIDNSITKNEYKCGLRCTFDTNNYENIVITLHINPVSGYQVTGVNIKRLQTITPNEHIYYFDNNEQLHWTCQRTTTSGDVYWKCGANCNLIPETRRSTELLATVLQANDGMTIYCVHDKGNVIPDFITYTLKSICISTIQARTSPLVVSVPKSSNYLFYISVKDNTRLLAIDNSKHIYSYKYYVGEIVELECTAYRDSARLHSLRWDYSSGFDVLNLTTGNISTLKTKLTQRNQNKQLFCKDIHAEAHATLTLILSDYTCQNQNISVPAFGCKTERTSFFITGLPERQELNFKGSKKCSVTLEFTEPLTLNLTCYRLLKNRNSYGPIKWRFKDQDLQTGDFNGCNGTVHQTFNVTDEDDGQEIVCEIKSDEEGGDEYEIKLGLKYEPPPTTAPTTGVISAGIVDQPILMTRYKRGLYHLRSQDKQTKNTVNEIDMEVNLNKNIYICNVKDKYINVINEDEITINVQSKNRIDKLWCFNEMSGTQNIIENIDENNNNHIYIKQITVKNSLQGIWNCTFLGRQHSFNSSWSPKYTYDKKTYLKTNCSLNVTVIDRPTSNDVIDDYQGEDSSSSPASEEHDEQNSMKEIKFHMKIKDKTYKCDVEPEAIHLKEGEDIKIIVTSKKFVNHFWCFSENDNSTNIMSDIITKETDKKGLYYKLGAVTRSMEGKWNCTFLGLPLYNYGPTYKFNGFTYLRANCNLNVFVEQLPSSTISPTIPVSTYEDSISNANDSSNYEIANMISFTIDIIKNTFMCAVKPKSIDLIEGEMLTIKINSKPYINYKWCFSGNDTRTNIAEDIEELNDESDVHTFVKYVDVTTSLEGKWNCSFLGFWNAPDIFKPRFTYNGYQYLRTNCSLHINVKPRSTTIVEPTSTVPITLSTTTTSSISTSTNSSTISAVTLPSSTPSSSSAFITNKTADSRSGDRSSKSRKINNNIRKELSDKTVTDSTTGSDKENEPTGTGISMMLISYCFAGIACVLILIVLVCVLVKHIKRSKRIKKSTTDVTYENLSGDTNRQFPPNLEALYAKPYDTRSLEEESPYAVTSYQDTDTYSVPYVETDVNKLYAKPVPKKDRKEQLYTKVLPKNQRKPKGSEVTYAEIEHTPTKRLVPKDNTATYSEIMSENYATANKGYENVCRGAYANTKDTEYAEPAYCEAKR